MKLNLIIKGLASYVPGVYRLFSKNKTGGTDMASHCYEVWLKHITMSWENGLKAIPDSVAELGPGDSIGVGLAALLSGVNKYYALDIVRYVDTERNLLIFDELVELFKKRAGKPEGGWPDYDSHLDDNLFPSHILTKKVLDAALTQERIESIRNILLNKVPVDKRIIVEYIVPWNDPRIISKESIDLIVSSSVLEHVADLENTYKAFWSWLKPGGLMSHQIHLASHGMSEKWNGHWAYTQLTWKIITGKRQNMINREPCSKHINLIEKNQFKILCLLKRYRPDSIERSQLSPYCHKLSEDDFRCSGVFVQAKKLKEK